jgi:hypothetical protein
MSSNWRKGHYCQRCGAAVTLADTSHDCEQEFAAHRRTLEKARADYERAVAAGDTRRIAGLLIPLNRAERIVAEDARIQSAEREEV